MVEEVDFDKTVDLIEVIFKCPGCEIVFSGTLYRGPDVLWKNTD